jgi:O-antigen ligase
MTLTHEPFAQPVTAIVPGRMRFPLVLLVAHAALGIAANYSPAVATGHAWLAVLTALALAGMGRRPEHALIAAAYVSAHEVLWRAGDATFFWEGPKYVIGAISLLVLVRFVGTPRSWLGPVAYGVVLSPSIVLTAVTVGVFALRDPLSFSLSGPASLALATLLLANVKVQRETIHRILQAVVLGAASMAALVLTRIYLADAIVFGTESNSETSGGYGPNQVSTLLGFGAFAAVVLALWARGRTRIGWAVMAAWLLGQCLLTFSRGGGLGFIVASLTLLVFQFGRTPGRAFVMTVAGVVIGLVLFAQLESFTNGTIGERFRSGNTTGRTQIAEDDLRQWRENPILGVGPGLAPRNRAITSERGAAAHTELTRLLAEHGVFGMLAVLALIGLAVASVVRARPEERGLSAALALWAFVTMLHAAMRISLVSFAFALAALRVSQRPARGPTPLDAGSEPIAAAG